MTRLQAGVGRARRAVVRLRLRVRWPAAARAVGLVGGNQAPVRATVEGVRSLHGRPVTARLRLTLPAGLSAADVERQVDRLAVALGAVHAELTRADRARTCLLTLTLADVLAEPLSEPSPLLLSAGNMSPSSPVPIGRCADGSLLAPRLVHQHVLVAGQTGSGKSTTVNNFMLFVLRCQPGTAELVVLDPKGGMDLGWVRHAAATRAYVDSDPAAAVAALEQVVVVLEERQRWAAAAGVATIEPDLRHPMLVVVIEELASYRRDRRYREDFDRHLAVLAERGRALAITVLAVLQTPSTDNLPSSIRNNLGVRLIHRAATSSHSEVALGDGTSKQPGWDASLLPYGPRHAGLGLAVSEQTGGRPQRFRSFYVSELESAGRTGAVVASAGPECAASYTQDRPGHDFDFSAADSPPAGPHPQP